MKKLFVMFLVASMATMVACKKDDPKPEQPAQPQDRSEMLANTSWQSTLQNTYNYSGVEMLLELTTMLDFKDRTNGSMFMDLNVTVPSLPDYPGQNNNESWNFTYTFDGSNLVITQTYVDDQTGETESWGDTLIYDSENETIMYDMNDQEMEEMFGTDELVFERIR